MTFFPWFVIIENSIEKFVKHLWHFLSSFEQLRPLKKPQENQVTHNHIQKIRPRWGVHPKYASWDRHYRPVKVIITW